MNLLLAGWLGLATICNQSTDQFLNQLNATENRLSFKNDGGLINGGVCWWHSRFQRAAWSLAHFAPELPRPSKAQIKSMINAIAHQTSVVTIGGYSNLLEFSSDNHNLIQNELEEWQKRDGFMNQAWIRGLSGRSSMSADQLESHLDQIFARYTQASSRNEVVWLMLQIQGITSHASLISAMTKTEYGYELQLIDSNHPQELVQYRYRVGDTALKNEEDGYTMIPYVGYSKDYNRIRSALKKYCQ